MLSTRLPHLSGDQGSIMLVGNLPHLSRLVSLLLTGNPEIEVVRFRNAGIVCLTTKRRSGRLTG